MAAVAAWIIAGVPSVLVAAVSAHRLFMGGSAWWLLGFVFAALLTPEVTDK